MLMYLSSITNYGSTSFGNSFKISHLAGQVVPVTKLNITPQVAPIILPHPPLKRKAAANPIAPSGQRRKKIPQSAISDSLPQQRQNTPAITAPIHIPTAPLQVEWEGTCPVCKFGCINCILEQKKY